LTKSFGNTRADRNLRLEPSFVARHEMIRRCGPVPGIAVIHSRFYDLPALMATLFSTPANQAFRSVIWVGKAWLTIRSYQLLIADMPVMA
jgi:hypothetical protein